MIYNNNNISNFKIIIIIKILFSNKKMIGRTEINKQFTFETRKISIWYSVNGKPAIPLLRCGI